MKMQSKILMALVSLLGMGLAIIIFGNVRIIEVVTENIENGLQVSAVSVRDTLDYADTGEYQLQVGILFKGDFNINDVLQQIADNLRNAADTDITIFYGDTRYMTSELDEQGERVIESKAGHAVIQKVLKNGQEHFTTIADEIGIISRAISTIKTELQEII